MDTHYYLEMYWAVVPESRPLLFKFIHDDEEDLKNQKMEEVKKS